MATLTTASSGNDSAGATWVGGVAPVAGDDIIILGHTLTLDRDIVYNSITFNVATSRLAIGGVTRSVEATNGFILGAHLSAVLITAAIPSGTSLTLTGSWSGNFNLLPLCASTGGNLTLQTVGANPASILFYDITGVNRVICSAWSAGTLTTIGRFNLPSWTTANALVTMSGGTWNQNHTGVSYFGNGGHRLLAQSGTATGSWTGDVESTSNLSGGLFLLSGSGNWAITGNSLLTNSTTSAGARTSIIDFVSYTGTVTITGKPCCRGKAVSIFGQLGSGGRINWRNQSVSIAANENIVMYMPGIGTLDLTDLVVTNAGKFIILVSAGATSVVTGVSTLITNTTTSAQAAVYTAAGELDGKVINLASDAPTLPDVEEVAGGIEYGYTISPLTGTGIISDPAVIAAAVGTALEAISATALRRFVTVDTGETVAADGSVASFGGGGGGGGATAVEIADEVQTRTIARVTLVDTVTTNSDMRGTDSAATVDALAAVATNARIAAQNTQT